MRVHKLRAMLLVAVVAAAFAATACGGSGPGDPYTGTIQIHWNNESYMPLYGVAAEATDSSHMPTGGIRIFIGTGGVSCANLNTFTGEGAYVSFDTVDKNVFTGSRLVAVLRAIGGQLRLLGSTGSVAITDVGATTVSGNLSVTASSTSGDPVTATSDGEFTVRRCF
jgi:hypothetical protein